MNSCIQAKQISKSSKKEELLKQKTNGEHAMQFDIWAEGCRPVIGAPELTTSELQLAQQVRATPKAELHFHVEGALGRYWRTTRSDNYAIFNRIFDEKKNGDHLFANWFKVIDTLQSERDFTDIAESIAEGFFESNVVWAEVFISPPDYQMRSKNSIPFATSLNWWCNAFAMVQSSSRLQIRLIVDLVRLYPPSMAHKWLQETIRARECKNGSLIVGIGLGGPENAIPLKEYRSVFLAARNNGLLCVAHAGEMGSGADIEEAIFELHASRIGHGIGLENNERAYQSLLKSKIAIESCPTSSICMGSCIDLERHPIKRWVKDNALVTLSTDDPTLFNTELTLEYVNLHRAFGWGIETLNNIIKNGFIASTMPEDRKARYLN